MLSTTSQSVYDAVILDHRARCLRSFEVTDEADDRLLLPVEVVANRLSLSRSRVYELLASGELPSIRIGRSRRIRRDDLIAYVDGLPLAR